jgi:hypothetical protein
MVSISSWRPILPHALIADARSAICAIAEDVLASGIDTHTSAVLSDFAVLFGYMSQVENSEKWRRIATNYLERSIEKASGIHGGWLGLYGGMCGVGWSVEHLTRLLDGDLETYTAEDPDDPIEAIDTYLSNALGIGEWQGPYDLISGLVGFGAYFLERLPRPSAKRGMELVLQRLKERHEKSWGGMTWRTPPQEIPYEQLPYAPDGYYNLGVAHGVPGVIKLLSEAVAAGIEEPGLEEMLDESVRWLLAREQPPNADSRYSSWFVPGSEPSGSRLGWCYGDLGIAAVLFGVGSQAERSDWRTAGTALLLRCTEWPREKQGINDAPLCHGAFGVAHIFNRAYQSTPDERFKQAANYWFERGLALKRSGEGVGGFFSYTPDRNPIWTPDYSLLSGGVGIALALISAVYAVAPAWDRVLLLSDFVRTRKTTSVAA